MTQMLYQTDSYLKDFTATVTSIDTENRAIVLDRTGFYPGGGGQPADKGTIVSGGVEFPIARVQKNGDGIAHALGGDPPLPAVGETIRGLVDWEHRYALMRTHSALHVLCGSIFRDYGAQVTGGNMEPLKGRLDFEFETLQGDFVREIEAAINKEVVAARDIRVKILPRDEAFQIPDLIRTKINLLPEGISEVRTVEIVGLDLQADGGTHVRNTSEIGHIRVADYKSKGKINKRIYIELDPA
jgi:misacylated tRNA(Ala) deacylase